MLLIIVREISKGVPQVRLIAPQSGFLHLSSELILYTEVHLNFRTSIKVKQFRTLMNHTYVFEHSVF